MCFLAITRQVTLNKADDGINHQKNEGKKLRPAFLYNVL